MVVHYQTLITGETLCPEGGAPEDELTQWPDEVTCTDCLRVIEEHGGVEAWAGDPSEG